MIFHKIPIYTKKKVRNKNVNDNYLLSNFWGISLVTYLGILALFLFTVTAIVTIRNRKGGRLLFNWHHRLAAIAIIVAFIHGILGLLGSDTIGEGVAGSVQDNDSRKSSLLSAGADIFNTHCRVCHPNSGNIINPDKPVKGSQKLRNFDTFLAYIRNPAAPMPAFSQETISDKQAEALYEYIR